MNQFPFEVIVEPWSTDLRYSLTSQFVGQIGFRFYFLAWLSTVYLFFNVVADVLFWVFLATFLWLIKYIYTFLVAIYSPRVGLNFALNALP